jgi:nuclear transport factor 2 (NTF2) superfamily protein
MPDRPPLPPFSLETATEKVRLAEDAWNSRDPDRVSKGPFGNREFPDAQMESRDRLSADQGIMGISRKSHCRALCL